MWQAGWLWRAVRNGFNKGAVFSSMQIIPASNNKYHIIKLLLPWKKLIIWQLFLQVFLFYSIFWTIFSTAWNFDHPDGCVLAFSLHNEKAKEQRQRSGMICTPPTRELLMTLLSHSSSSQPFHLPQKSPSQMPCCVGPVSCWGKPSDLFHQSFASETGWGLGGCYYLAFILDGCQIKTLSPQMVLEQNSEQEGNARPVLPLEITFDESRGCVIKGSIQETRIMWSGALV